MVSFKGIRKTVPLTRSLLTRSPGLRGEIDLGIHQTASHSAQPPSSLYPRILSLLSAVPLALSPPAKPEKEANKEENELAFHLTIPYRISYKLI